MREKLLAAESAEEVTELVKADGQEMIEPEQRRLWKELKAKNEQADKELSVEELEAVSGGADIYKCTKCGQIRKISDSDDDNKCDRY